MSFGGPFTYQGLLGTYTGNTLGGNFTNGAAPVIQATPFPFPVPENPQPGTIVELMWDGQKWCRLYKQAFSPTDPHPDSGFSLEELAEARDFIEANAV